MTVRALSPLVVVAAPEESRPSQGCCTTVRELSLDSVVREVDWSEGLELPAPALSTYSPSGRDFKLGFCGVSTMIQFFCTIRYDLVNCWFSVKAWM